MAAPTRETLPVRSDADVVAVRQTVRARCVQLGLSLVDQTKMITAASELARNTLLHGRGGVVRIELVQESRRGLRLVFEDEGPGISDIPLALTDGYSTGSGLGVGLPGARRLVDVFEIQSTPGQGTRVSITKWK